MAKKRYRFWHMYYPCLNGVNVYVAVGAQCAPYFNRLIRHLNANFLDLHDDDSLGWTWQIEPGTYFIWISDKLERTYSDHRWGYCSIIAHECFHLALRVSEYISSHKPQDAEEPLAYLISSVAGVFCSLFEHKRSSKLKDILSNKNAHELILL